MTGAHSLVASPSSMHSVSNRIPRSQLRSGSDCGLSQTWIAVLGSGRWEFMSSDIAQKLVPIPAEVKHTRSNQPSPSHQKRATSAPVRRAISGVVSFTMATIGGGSLRKGKSPLCSSWR